MRFLLIVAVSLPLIGATLTQTAPDSVRAISNPMAGDPEAVRAGAKLYDHECAACHGANREGMGRRPPLKTRWVAAAPPGALAWVLRNGSLAHGMPSFASLPEPERWQIISFLQHSGR